MESKDVVMGLAALNAGLNLVLAAWAMWRGEPTDLLIIKMVLWMILAKVME